MGWSTKKWGTPTKLCQLLWQVETGIKRFRANQMRFFISTRDAKGNTTHGPFNAAASYRAEIRTGSRWTVKTRRKKDTMEMV